MMADRDSSRSFVPALLLLGLVTGCRAAPPADPGSRAAADEIGSEAAAVADAPAVPSEGTREMVRLLDEVIAAIPAWDNPYGSRARLAYLEAMTPPSEPRKLLEYRFNVAVESLRAGESEAAIAGLERLLEQAGEGPRLNTRYLRELLAIAYLRLGEQENCLANYSAESCILPIRGGGVHRLTRGSRAAVDQYRALLEDDPDELRSRWLLNVAYMTLGEYPEAVPARWLIPPAAFVSDYDLPRFPNIAPRLGLDVVGLSGGSIMDDFDGDGTLDIWASSFGLRHQLRYFRNNGDGTFSERTRAAGLEGIVGGLNLIHADYDNDGHRDVLVLRGAWLGEQGKQPNSLLRNNGDGTFSDVTRAAGVLSFHPTQTATWGDFNNDGWLDLFIGNESSPKSVNPCELFFSNRDGTFREAAESAGVAIRAPVKAVISGDYDNDGLLDLYVSSLSGPNLLLHNLGPDADGRWRFADEAARAGVQEPSESFPSWFWDYDNDGWLDLLVLGYSGRRLGLVAGDVAAAYLGLPQEGSTARLYRNDASGGFEDVTAAAGVAWPYYAMGSNFGDLDNDGWLDFYVGTGDPDLRSVVPNIMFRNDRGRRFQDVTSAGGFGHLQKGHGVAFGDLDNDGDQDIYAVMGGAVEGDVAFNVLFENPGHGNRWITVRLVGTESNRDAIGARLRVVVARPGAGSREIFATVSTGGSFGSSSLQQEIGLGDAVGIERIEVVWPGSGRRQTVSGVEMGQIIRVVEGRPGFERVTLERIRWPAEAAGGEHRHHGETGG